MPLTEINTLLASEDFLFGLYTPDITELSVVKVGANAWVYAHTSNADDGIITMSMDGTGAVAYVDNTGMTGPSIYKSFDEADPSGFEAFTVDGATYLIGSNYFEVDGVAVDHGTYIYQVESDGSLSTVKFASRDENETLVSTAIETDGFPFDGFMTIEVSDAGGNRFRELLVTDFSGIDDSSPTTGVFGPNPTNIYGNADVHAVARNPILGDVIFAFTRSDNHNIAWLELDGPLRATETQLLNTGSAGAAGVATDMEIVTFDRDLILITTSPTHGLRTFEIGSAFAAGAVDVIGGSAAVSPWEGAEMAVFRQDGRTFVVTGGNALGVFEVSDEGALFKAEVIAQDGGPAHDIEVLKQGGETYLVVANDVGVTSYLFTPGPAQDQRGTSGADRLTGDTRNNLLEGLGGNDVLKGLGGTDSLIGAAGKDSLFGGAGQDYLFGGGANDHLSGGGGVDRLNGDAGRDVLVGGGGKDFIYGGDAGDRLSGGGATDYLYGGTGSDVLDGGARRDFLTGGGGSDTFVFDDIGGRDRITDFSGADVIDMRAFGSGVKFRDLDIVTTSTNTLSKTIVQYDGHSIELTKIGVNRYYDLNADDFLFG